MDYQKYLKIAEQATLLAGEYLLKNFGPTKEMTHKIESHFGIKDDIICSNIYIDLFKAKSPEVSLYTEEGDKNLGDLTWVIDPIEGTSNYRVGNPFFATQVCLLEKHQPVVAVVYAPYLNQMFTAVIGAGTLLNGKKTEMVASESLRTSLISLGKGTDVRDLEWLGENVKKLAPGIRTIRVYGATGLELAYVASGMIDVHINNGSQLYDFAPGVLLVRESGGVVLNEKGQNWSFEDNFVIASTSKLAEEVLKIVV